MFFAKLAMLHVATRHVQSYHIASHRAIQHVGDDVPVHRVCCAFKHTSCTVLTYCLWTNISVFDMADEADLRAAAAAELDALHGIKSGKANIPSSSVKYDRLADEVITQPARSS